MADEKRKQELDKIKAKFGTTAGANDADYNPHDYREVAYGTNFLETLVHVLKASLGTGILAMPEAFKHAGMINGIVFTLIIGIVCTYGIHLLIRSQYALCKRLRVPYLSYPVAMKAALLVGPKSLSKFGTTSQIMVDAFLIVYQTGTCCVYIIFVGANIKALTDVYLEEPYTIELYIMCLLPFFLFILSIPNLKWLAPFSLFSNAITFVTFGIMLYYIFEDLGSFEGISYFGTLTDFPLFIGTTLFAVAAVGVVTSVEKNMATPSQFGAKYGVLNISMFIIVFFYTLMGFFGYWRYKDASCPSITLNLPKEAVGAKVVQGLYAVAIYISYGLNGYVPIDIIWNTYLGESWRESPYHLAWEYALRYALVFLTFLLAISIPLLGLFISFFGALCMAALELIFPALMDLCVKWPDQLGRGNWVIVTDVLMMICGLIGLFSGSYTSLYEIVVALQQRYGTSRAGDLCV